MNTLSVTGSILKFEAGLNNRLNSKNDGVRRIYKHGICSREMVMKKLTTLFRLGLGVAVTLR